MAQFIINTTEEEREKVIEAIKKVEGETTPLSVLSKMTGMTQSRVRYAIEDLIDAGRVDKIPTKAFNKHYVRYCYKLK